MPSTKHGYNERSLAIDLISDINVWLVGKELIISRAGGEHSLRTTAGMLFPDILLFGDRSSGTILQGWELKLPDTPIDDADFIDNASKKARHLGLSSFLLWNVTYAVLYTIDGEEVKPIKTWSDLSHITKREEVRPNYELILQQLFSILDDLVSLFVSGSIKPTGIVGAITNDVMTNLLLEDVDAYAQNIQKHANILTKFEDEVALWWLAAKQDFPGETDKWRVLAQTNIVALFNKLIFAHVLRNYNEAANLVDSITEGMSVTDGLSVFEEISKTADFWNIFSKSLGEEQLTPFTWQKIVRLNQALRDFNFSEIDTAVTQDLLEKALEKTKRKAAGQFATPQQLAELVVRLTIDDVAEHHADLFSGTGTIARAIYDYKLDKKITDPHKTTWASDKFALPVKVTTLAMVDPARLGAVMNIFQADATKLKTGQEIQLRHPYDGHIVTENLPVFKGIVSNLPFVQQEDLTKLNPNIDQINDTIVRLTGDTSLSLGARSDLYAYLPFYLWSLLANDGRLGIIVSNSWLGTKMGEEFYRALRRFYYIETVITSGAGRWFKNADVVANIIILKKNNHPAEVIRQDIKFVELIKPIGDYTTEDMITVRAMLGSGTAHTASDLCVINRYDQTLLNKIEKFSLPLSALFADLHWIDTLEDVSVPISQFFQVNRGERRGWDEMFYPAQKGDIEDEYIKPVLKSSRSLTGLLAQPDGISFCCTASKEELESKGHNGALRWIQTFEHRTNTAGEPLPKALRRAGIHWYTMNPNTTADLVTSINPGDRLFFGRFHDPTFVDQRLIRFTAEDRTQNIDLLHALLSSVFGMFYLEALGFGRGQGALDLNPTKLRQSMRMLSPEKLSKEAAEHILSKFQPLLDRPIKKIVEELNSKDRQEFDAAVFEAYGIPELLEPVTKALLQLYEIRNAVN